MRANGTKKLILIGTGSAKVVSTLRNKESVIAVAEWGLGADF